MLCLHFFCKKRLSITAGLTFLIFLSYHEISFLEIYICFWLSFLMMLCSKTSSEKQIFDCCPLILLFFEHHTILFYLSFFFWSWHFLIRSIPSTVSWKDIFTSSWLTSKMSSKQLKGILRVHGAKHSPYGHREGTLNAILELYSKFYISFRNFSDFACKL